MTKTASTPTGWVDYKWVTSVTKEIQATSAYFEKDDDIVVSTAYYKK